MANDDAMTRLSKWRFITSSGGSLGVSAIVAVGITTGKLYISQNPKADQSSPGVAILSYKGIGPGVSVGLPVDISFSTAKMWSEGDICLGPLSTGADIELEDLTGTCLVRVTSASAARSYSCTQIYFQPKTTSVPAICKAIGTLFGKGWSLPSAGVVEYTCYMTIDRVIPDNLEWTDPKEPAALLRPNYQVIPPMLTMPADVLFQFNRADLKPSAAHALQQALQLITTQRVRSVIIEGHTDSIGSAHYNLQLSGNRANSVKSWFVRQGGTAADSFVTKGLGKSQPIAPNTNPDGSDNPEGRQQNRRVSIILIP
jgi:outer membrane protein OmpA-like peptidoglycan-associated protein